MTENQTIENGFWNIEDLSYYLKVKIKTLYAMIPDIPHYRVGKLIRFKKQEIDSWMEGNRGSAYNGIKKSRMTESRRADKHKHNVPIDKLIRKAIDQSNIEVYNPDHGKSDRIEGPRKEINNGSV